MHLITKVVQANAIEEEVQLFVKKLIKTVSGESIALTKQLMATFPGISIIEQLALAATYNAKARSTNDCKKGISAFLNKEKLTWL